MRFNRPRFNAQTSKTNQSIQGKHELVKKKERQLDINVCFKEYVQSFLFWMYRQNPSFSEYLSDEEIVNFFFQKIDLPIWIQFIRNKSVNSGFRFMTEVYQYVKEYKKHADMMIYTYPIFALDSVDYVEVKLENETCTMANYDECISLNLNPHHTLQKDIDIYSYLKGEN